MTVSIQIAIVLGAGFLASLLLNAVLIWYARASIQQLAFVSDNIKSLKDSIGDYSAHLKRVYELEMFYGDETLGALIKHTTELHDSMALYEDFYDLFPGEDDDPADEEDPEEMIEETQREETMDATT